MTTRREGRPSKKQREAVREEVAARPELDQDKHHRETYQAWCSANQMPELPTGAGGVTGELVLLRYLHSTAMARDWAHATCSNAARVVARHHMRHGLGDPRGPQAQAWLKARLRQTGKRTTRPIDALSASEVRSSMASLDEQPQAAQDVDDLLSQRALLALADLLDDDGPLKLNPLTSADPERPNRPNPTLATLMALRCEDFSVRPHELRVHVAGEVLVVLKARTPEHFEMLAAAVRAGRPHPLHPAASPTDHDAIRRYLRRARRKATTAAYTVDGNRAHGHDRRQTWAAQWWTNADRDHRLRLMALMDPGLRARTQDAAYLLMGLVGLLRNAELVRFDIRDMVPRPDATGFDYSLAKHKSAMHAARHGSIARPLQGSLEHETDAGHCPPVCAACAMDRHLRVRAWHGAQPGDPLFVAYNSPRSESLQRLASTAYGSRVVKQAASSTLQDGSDRRLGTRTMRVSGATWLHQAGTSYQELQEIGTWSSVLYARLYVRRYDPWASSDLVLGLEYDANSRPTLR